MNVIFSGYTAITPMGRVDMVPFLRRIRGNKHQEFSENERDAAVFALHSAGFGPDVIAPAVRMSFTDVSDLLAGVQRKAVAEEPRVPLKVRRMAERVLIDGRLVHPDASHGTSAGYDHWWCRCVPCCGARAVRAAAQRRRVAERKACHGVDR